MNQNREIHNDEIRKIKRALAVVMGEEGVDHKSVGERIKCFTSFHDICIEWRGSIHSEFLEATRFYPQSWLNPPEQSADFIVDWRQGKYCDREIWKDADPNCDQFETPGCLHAVQRDFIARQEGKKVYLLSDKNQMDGYHNFLRWLLPRELIRKGKLLVHSSAVIDEREQAYVFLGKSGAGKTSIAGLTESARVLGDDMNLLSFEGGQCFVEAAAVGQAVQNTTLFARKFPVRGIFDLYQAKEYRLEEISQPKSALALYAGAANLFLGEVPMETVQSLQNVVFSVCKNVVFYNLYFKLDRKVWDYVYQCR